MTIETNLLGLVRKHWLAISVTPAITAAGALLVAYGTSPTYRSTAVVAYDAPSYEQSGISGSIGELASLVGLAGQPSNSRSLALAVLKSRELSAQFISKNNLAELLFPDLWDEINKRWKTPSSVPPSSERLFNRFDRRTRIINDDKSTGLIGVTFVLQERTRVASLTNALVASADDKLRNLAIKESESTLKYLGGELQAAQTPELRTAIARLMQAELQKISLARSRERFAFRTVDVAVTPETQYWPQPVLMVAVAIALGLVVGLCLAFLLESSRQPTAQ